MLGQCDQSLSQEKKLVRILDDCGVEVPYLGGLSCVSINRGAYGELHIVDVLTLLDLSVFGPINRKFGCQFIPCEEGSIILDKREASVRLKLGGVEGLQFDLVA